MNEYERHIHPGDLKPERWPSDFDSLREDFANAFSAINDYAQAQRRHAESVSTEVERLWADNAELRDELHAVSNRLENLTRSIVTAPAEVAQRGFVRLADDLDTP